MDTDLEFQSSLEFSQMVTRCFILLEHSVHGEGTEHTEKASVHSD